MTSANGSSTKYLNNVERYRKSNKECGRSARAQVRSGWIRGLCPERMMIHSSSSAYVTADVEHMSKKTAFESYIQLEYNGSTLSESMGTRTVHWMTDSGQKSVLLLNKLVCSETPVRFLCF